METFVNGILRCDLLCSYGCDYLGCIFLRMGWRSGESTLLPPMCGFDPILGVICGLSLLLVLVLALRGFSPGTPVFPSPQKPTLPNSNSI